MSSFSGGQGLAIELAQVTQTIVLQEFEFAGKDALEKHAEIVKGIWGKPRKWRFDYALPAIMVAVEVEGGHWTGGRHNTGAGFLKDMDKYNTATALGWRLFRTTPKKADQARLLAILANLTPD